MTPKTGLDWWSAGIVLFILAVCFNRLAPAYADPDLWGHVLFGQRSLAMGAIERVDPFSYLSADRWINHEILSELSFGALYNAGGSAALVWLRLLIGLFLCALLLRHLMKHGLDALRAGLVLLPPAMLWIIGLQLVRPQMYTYLGFALVLLAIEAAERGRERAAWWIPLICAVWINFHGGVLAGCGMVACWWAGRLIGAIKERAWSPGGLWRHLRLPTLVGAASALALLVNPYGIDLPAFLLSTGTVPRPDIIEWRPLELTSDLGFFYLVVLSMGIVAVWRRPPKTPITVLWLVGAFLPLTALRHVPLFGLTTVILLAGTFHAAWSRPITLRPGPVRVGTATGLAMTAVIALVTALPATDCVRINRNIAPYPVRAVRLLSDSGVSGNLAIYFDWGEYAIWHLEPDIKVSMDGRRETVYADTIYQEYQRFQSGTGSWSDLTDRPETDMVLMSNAWPTPNLLELDPGWEAVYRDSLATMFARPGTAQLEALRGTTASDVRVDGHGMCAP